MAIDPNILLQPVYPDIGQALLRGLQGAQSIQAMREYAQQSALQSERMKVSELERQAAQQKLDKANREAEILRFGITAKKLMPYIQSKDIAGFKRNLANSGLPTDDIEDFSALADKNAWDSIQSVANQGIQIARDTGVFGKDYSGSVSGYTPSGVAAYNQIQQLQAIADALPEGPDKQKALANVELQTRLLLAPKTTSGGGGTTILYNPLTGSREIVGATATAGGIGAPPPAPSAPGAAPPDLNAPIESQVPTYGADPASVIRLRDQALTAGKKLSEQNAKRIADYESFDSDLRANIAGLNEQFPELTIMKAYQDAPNTSVSKLAKDAISTLFTNDAAAAEANLESYLQSLAEAVPFAPGSQSNVEYQARLARIGDIMKKGISPQAKLDMTTRYLAGQEAKARSKMADAAKLREEYFGKAKPAAPQERQPTRTMGAPAGIDQAVWDAMTPEERALWQ